MQSPFQPHSDGRYHVNDLLKYHDRNFIQNAYRAILKRGPDAAGYRGFIESLRSARLNKIDILASLRYSAEGRSKKVEIEGLRTPAIIRKAYRVPVLGYLLNLAVALARLPLMIRSEQQFEAHVLAQQELVVDQLNHLGRTLRVHSGEVSLLFEQQNQSIKQQLDEVRHQYDRFIVRLDEESARREQTETRLGEELVRQEQGIRVLSEQLARWDEGLKTFQIRALQWRAEISAAETELRQMNTVFREQLELTDKTLKREVLRLFEKQQAVTTELVHQQQG